MTQEALFPIRNAKAQRNRGAYGGSAGDDRFKQRQHKKMLKRGCGQSDPDQDD